VATSWYRTGASEVDHPEDDQPGAPSAEGVREDKPSSKGCLLMLTSTARFSPERLRALRRAAGVSRVALAYQLGVSMDTLVAWEAGRSVPKGNRFPGICAVLECAVEDLFEDVSGR
jgi:DNA-binding transcriptional regulator YiaG